MTHPRRSAALYTILLLGTIAVGLATRRFPTAFPAIVAEYGGDTLWAAMVFWIVSLWRRTATTRLIAIVALAVSCAVEVSQLYHALWIDAVRATRIGALALGYGFLWSDLVCYAVGVSLAALLDMTLQSRHVTAHPVRRTR
ncbi:MAG: DUF2809 domain-containing protein [Gemmatimonadaceae bacterium]|nr:DUF2809 domain-containing protein [Gemmatimonadaceae bacterium]